MKNPTIPRPNSEESAGLKTPTLPQATRNCERQRVSGLR